MVKKRRIFTLSLGAQGVTRRSNNDEKRRFSNDLSVSAAQLVDIYSKNVHFTGHKVAKVAKIGRKMKFRPHVPWRLGSNFRHEKRCFSSDLSADKGRFGQVPAQAAPCQRFPENRSSCTNPSI